MGSTLESPIRIDADGETVYEEREILDEDLGPSTGPDRVAVLGEVLKAMIAESAGEEPSPGDVVTFTAKVPA